MKPEQIRSIEDANRQLVIALTPSARKLDDTWAVVKSPDKKNSRALKCFSLPGGAVYKAEFTLEIP